MEMSIGRAVSIILTYMIYIFLLLWGGIEFFGSVGWGRGIFILSVVVLVSVGMFRSMVKSVLA